MAITTLQALGAKIAVDDAIAFGNKYSITCISSYDEHVKHAVDADMPVAIFCPKSTEMSSAAIYSCKADLLSFIGDCIRDANEHGTFVLCPAGDGCTKLMVFDRRGRPVTDCLIYGIDQDTLSMYRMRERLIQHGPLTGLPYGKGMSSGEIEDAIGYDTWFPILTCDDMSRHPLAIVDDRDDSSMMYVFFETMSELVMYCHTNGKTLVPDTVAEYPPSIPYVCGCHGEYNPDPEWEDNHMFYVVGASRDEIIAAFA